MRISDWSSDVCSSDLKHGPTEIAIDAGTFVPFAGTAPGVTAAQPPSAVSTTDASTDLNSILISWVLSNFPATSRQGSSDRRSEEHTSELQSLMRISYAVFCLKKKNKQINTTN